MVGSERQSLSRATARDGHTEDSPRRKFKQKRRSRRPRMRLFPFLLFGRSRNNSREKPKAKGGGGRSKIVKEKPQQLKKDMSKNSRSVNVSQEKIPSSMQVKKKGSLEAAKDRSKQGKKGSSKQISKESYRQKTREYLDQITKESFKDNTRTKESSKHINVKKNKQKTRGSSRRTKETMETNESLKDGSKESLKNRPIELDETQYSTRSFLMRIGTAEDVNLGMSRETIYTQFERTAAPERPAIVTDPPLLIKCKGLPINTCHTNVMISNFIYSTIEKLKMNIPRGEVDKAENLPIATK
ncbi:hypothetical protein DICVIV_07190 [Dictyocaulus viviparus]|uniref:Uncharacterized protein n=1 Tax=Dictyocaulus viviparus TaxID=29172 RepID=A0A0D8XSH6_DICVI|nr:hypothetical protein DICVIV_07190 [Dictyocaulus viviparus]